MPYARNQLVYIYRGDTRSAVQAEVIGIRTNEDEEPGPVWVTTYQYVLKYYSDQYGGDVGSTILPEGLVFANTTDYNNFQSGVYNWDGTTIAAPP